MRDYGFEIYKVLVKAPEKKEEEKKDKKKEDVKDKDKKTEDKPTKVTHGLVCWIVIYL